MPHTTPPGFCTEHCIAIITGASSGLGAEFARQLAEKAACLVLAARSLDAMKRLEDELKTKNSTLKVIVCDCDLATDDGRAKLWQCLDAQEIKPTLLINNAGLGDYGSFADSTAARTRQMIDVNVTALTLLTHEFVQRTTHAKTTGAAIVNVASLASTLPIADLAVYAATKAYVLSFSEALNVELKTCGIQVLAVCPGPTPTNFGKNARREGKNDIDRSGQNLLAVPPERVVVVALQSLIRGKACVFPGKGVKMMATLARLMPRPLLRSIVALRHRRSQARNEHV